MYIGLCRHHREFNVCEQCRWEAREQSKRFDEYVAKTFRSEREAIERSPWWQENLQLLRSVAATLGVSYDEFSSNFSSLNYIRQSRESE